MSDDVEGNDNGLAECNTTFFSSYPEGIHLDDSRMNKLNFFDVHEFPKLKPETKMKQTARKSEASASGYSADEVYLKKCNNVEDGTSEITSEIKQNSKKRGRPRKSECKKKDQAEIKKSKYKKKGRAGGESFTCDICGKQLGRYDTLYRHKKLHLVIKPHICNICGRSFVRLCDIRRHATTHKT